MHTRTRQGLFSLAFLIVLGGLSPGLNANIDLYKNGDVNGDRKQDVSDAIYTLNWLFLSGPPPIDILCPEAPDQDPCDEDAEAAGISSVRLFDMGDLETRPQVGSSWLSRNSRGISLMVNMSEIPVGHAVTLWLIVFNNPEECVNGPGGCAGVNGDLENPVVQGDILGEVGECADIQSVRFETPRVVVPTNSGE